LPLSVIDCEPKVGDVMRKPKTKRQKGKKWWIPKFDFVPGFIKKKKTHSFGFFWYCNAVCMRRWWYLRITMSYSCSSVDNLDSSSLGLCSMVLWWSSLGIRWRKWSFSLL
jgi:hypothetical protein